VLHIEGDGEHTTLLFVLTLVLVLAKAFPAPTHVLELPVSMMRESTRAQLPSSASRNKRIKLTRGGRSSNADVREVADRCIRGRCAHDCAVAQLSVCVRMQCGSTLLIVLQEMLRARDIDVLSELE
jgi:hypothetical protein